jgi:hypothetical protein
MNIETENLLDFILIMRFPHSLHGYEHSIAKIVLKIRFEQ